MIDAGIELLRQYGGALVFAAGVLGATLFIWRRAVVPIRRWAMRVGATIESLNAVAQAQLTPNGGGSLLDKVGKIDPNHDEAVRHWKTLEDEQAAIRKEVADLTVAVKAIQPSVVIHNEQPHVGGGE